MSLSAHNPHTAFARSLERPTASVAVPSGFLCCLLMLKHLEIYKDSRSRSYLQDCICFCSYVKVLSDMLQTCMQSFWLISSACINSYSYISFQLFCMNTLLFLPIGDCRIITQRKHLVYFFMPELRYSLNNTTWLLLVIKVVLKVTVSFSSLSPSNIPCNVNNASVRKLGLAAFNWALSFFPSALFVHPTGQSTEDSGQNFVQDRWGNLQANLFSFKLFISPTYLYVCFLIALSCKYLLIQVERRERIVLTTVNL